jgi:hypothetical protein
MIDDTGKKVGRSGFIMPEMRQMCVRAVKLSSNFLWYASTSILNRGREEEGLEGDLNEEMRRRR